MTAQPQLDLLESPVPPWDRFGPGFVDPPGHRLGDPQTSIDAAAAYVEPAGKQNAQIASYLLGRGPAGATARQMAADLGWTLEQVDRRLAALRRARYVCTFNGKSGPGCLGVVVRRGGNYCIHVHARHRDAAIALHLGAQGPRGAS